MSTHLRCSSVSGMGRPRASLIRSKAVSAGTPDETSRHAATSPDRPIPWRQWRPTALPSSSSVSTDVITSRVSRRDEGTPRSGIGNDTNSRPPDRHWSASPVNSSSFASSGVSSDTITWKPDRAHRRISSGSQSPPRGLATNRHRRDIARRSPIPNGAVHRSPNAAVENPLRAPQVRDPLSERQCFRRSAFLEQRPYLGHGLSIPERHDE